MVSIRPLWTWRWAATSRSGSRARAAVAEFSLAEGEEASFVFGEADPDSA